MTPKPENHILLAYVADLELEVDRLRKHVQLVQQEMSAGLQHVLSLCGQTTPEGALPAMGEIAQTTRRQVDVLRDLRDPAGYHPAHDQVVAIAVRPLVEQVFRWQQRIWNSPHAALRIELQAEHVEWFPARLRHILDNLISNALKFRDPAKGETRVTVELRTVGNNYELRVSDNGLGMPADEKELTAELFYRSAPGRAAGLGVGLPVVKLLVEHSGGTVTTQSGDGQGTTITATLPRYDIDDFLT